MSKPKTEKRSFRVGDRVQYKTPDYEDNYYPGTVINVIGDNVYKQNDTTGNTVTCLQTIKNEELVLIETEPKDTNVESELEKLVRRANSRVKVLEKLYAKYEGQFEVVDRGTVVKTVHFRKGITYRIKPAAAPARTFEPFHIGPKNDVGIPAWLVTLSDDGETVKIGCQDYKVRHLLESLEGLVTDNKSAVGPYAITATRTGITRDRNSISWADAEKLLAALRKVGAGQ